MNADQLDWLTERVLGAVFEVTNTPGAGFLEKVYQRALLRELGLRGIRAVAEASFTVTYKGHPRPRTLRWFGAYLTNLAMSSMTAGATCPGLLYSAGRLLPSPATNK